MIQRRGQRTLLVAGALILSIMLIMRYLPIPYLYLAGLLGVVCLLFAARSMDTWTKVSLVNVAVVLFAVGAAELYFY